MSDASPERTRDLERLITFLDAIVAIAITLLVLPLAELAADVGDDTSVWRVMREHAGQFGGFALSFVVIARIWYAQHKIVRHATDAPAAFVGWLMAWTATIVFLPFATALLADAGDQAATKVAYIGTLVLSTALLGVVAAQVRRQLPETQADRPRLAPALLDTVALLVALGVSLLLPVLGYAPLLLLVVSGLVEDRIHRRPAQAGSA